MSKAFVATLFAALIVGSAGAAETTRYIALVNSGKDRAGHQTVTRNGDQYRVEYVFKDNGRGPELKEEYTVGADGTFTRYHVAGTSTFGSLVEETFSRSGDTVRWKSTSDKGEQAVQGAALYSPLSGTPQTFSVLIAALAKRPDGKLPMIPSGTLTARTLAEAQVTRGAEKRTVRLIAFTGIGFTPLAVWATTDSTPRLFAFVYPGYLQLIEEGWEKNGGALEARQNTAEKE
ncbi:MAG: amidohydrolase, partial [Myxococcales bacterium]|nr:amidohydrolase [Myxococcales bacterium]